MQGNRSIVFSILVVSILAAISACREPNPFYCPAGEQCAPLPESCGDIDCELPTPVCKSAEQGTCVACTTDTHCPTRNPVCDMAVNQCVECRVSTDCTESALCLADNKCAEPDDVAYVDEQGNDANECTLTKPCATLDRGVSLGRKYIKATGRLNDGAKVDKSVSIFGEPGTRLVRSMNGTVLEIKSAATVSLRDLEIEGGSATGIGVLIKESAIVTMTRVSVHNHNPTGVEVLLGKLTMNDSSVFGNAVLGVNIVGTAATIERSSIYGNTGTAGIASAPGSTVTISSSVIAKNTGSYGLSLEGIVSVKNSVISANRSANLIAGVLLLSIPMVFEFNTVSDNATTGTDLGVSCGTPGTKISNNILTGNAISAVCDVQHSLTDAPVPSGTGNKPGAPMFINVDDPLNPMFYRIRTGSEAKDSADPNAREAKDIDGQERSDSRNDMGADELN